MKSGNKQWWPGCFYNTFICSYNLDLHDLQCISTLIDKHILLIMFLTDFQHFTVNCARWCSRTGGPQWWLCCFINLMKYIYHKPWNLVPHCFLGVTRVTPMKDLQSCKAATLKWFFAPIQLNQLTWFVHPASERAKPAIGEMVTLGGGGQS